MFLKSLKGANRKELESLCEELTADLKMKRNELVRKDEQIDRLAKNNRQWTRKYYELEQSISENSIDVSDVETFTAEHEEQTKNLQMKLIKLNRKNSKLEKRLELMAQEVETNTKKNESDQLASNEAAAKEAAATELVFGVVDEDPEFSPEYQKIIDRYTQDSPG